MFTFIFACDIIGAKANGGKREMTVGENISRLRKSRGMTQLALANAVGVTDKAVSKWERNLSCPDISALLPLSEALGVSVDELLGAKEEGKTEYYKDYISLEKYLMGAYGYTVCDYHPKEEEIVLVMDCPDVDETAHGYPLSAKSGVEFNKFMFGESTPLSKEMMSEIKLGVTYVSNVPLLNLEPPINKLVDELEYTRLNKYHVNLLLLDGFVKKMERLILCESVRVIALTRWFNQKYFGEFIAHASPSILKKIQDKVASGRLKILFVGPPVLWNNDEHKKYDGLFELKEYISKKD